MIFVMTHSNILNLWALKTKRVPKLMLKGPERPWPKQLVGSLTFWRILLESPVLRNGGALLPLGVAKLFLPHLVTPALALSATLIFLLLAVEGNLLPIRARDGEEREIERVLDLLRQRGRAVLTRIAAARGVEAGTLVLVVEQSSFAYLPRLTILSVQSLDDKTVLKLEPEEQRALGETLFAEGLTEQALLRVNLVRGRFLREVSLDAATISAHARLAGLAATR